MARKSAGGGVDPRLGIVHRRHRLAEPVGDQLELPGIGGNISGGENTGLAGLHLMIHPHRVLFEGDRPVFQRAKRGIETDLHEDCVHVQGAHFVGLIVADHRSR